MSETTTLVKSDFAILDKQDEEQIKNAGEAVKQALCYDLNKNGKKTRQITFIGLKWITVKMAQSGQALEVINSSVQLEKDDATDKALWFWRSLVKCRNQKTGLETEGVAECPYLDDKSAYNKFARTIAHSKAERNAWRKQIPELEITSLLKSVKPDEAQSIQGTDAPQTKANDYCHCPDESTVPEWESGLCKNCNQKMSDYKKTRIQSS